MKKKDYIAWMKEAGWYKHPQDFIFYIDLADRQLISFAHFSKYTGGFDFSDAGSVGFPWFSEIIKYIQPGMKDSIWLTQRHNSSFKTTGEGSAGFIIECTDELIRWANSINPYEEIKKLAEHEKVYADSSHLAALALTGDRDQLGYYLKFRAEHPNPKEEPWVPGTLGPLITKENIERAIEIAIKHQEEPII